VTAKRKLATKREGLLSTTDNNRLSLKCSLKAKYSRMGMFSSNTVPSCPRLASTKRALAATKVGVKYESSRCTTRFPPIVAMLRRVREAQNKMACLSQAGTSSESSTSCIVERAPMTKPFSALVM